MRAGEVYHLCDVEPLSGGRAKSRYVVVVTDPQDVLLDRPVFAVACTSTVRPADIANGAAIELPWHPAGQAGTGFRRRTWAVPAWLLRIHPSQLGRCVGHIPSTKLAEIILKLPADPRS